MDELKTVIMNFKLNLVVLLIIPVTIIAQAPNDTAMDRIFEICDGKVFTKTEVKPSLKIAGEAYGDSLMSYLLSKNVVIKNSAMPCRFILTSHSQVLNIKVGINPTPATRILSDAVLHFKDLLKPAVQNNLQVCSYVTFMVVFEKDRINVDILQGF